MPGTLYNVALSQPSRSCILLVNEANLDVEFQHVDLMNGEHKREPYITEVNPAGMVPAYVEGDFKLAEGAAILVYLAEANNLTNWYPTDPKDKAKVHQWLHWHHTGTRKATTTLFQGALFGSGAADNVEFTNVMKFLESALAKSKFIASTDHPTVVDLLILPELDQLGPDFIEGGIFDFTPYPNVVRYMADLSAVLTSYSENKANAIAVVRMIQSRMNQST